MTTDFEEFLEVGEMDRFVTPDQVSAAYSTSNFVVTGAGGERLYVCGRDVGRGWRPAGAPAAARRYLGKHHIIWLRLPCTPGDATRLTLTCRTRLAAARSPRRTGLLGRFQDAVGWARRVTGQEPYWRSTTATHSSTARTTRAAR